MMLGEDSAPGRYWESVGKEALRRDVKGAPPSARGGGEGEEDGLTNPQHRRDFHGSALGGLRKGSRNCLERWKPQETTGGVGRSHKVRGLPGRVSCRANAVTKGY